MEPIHSAKVWEKHCYSLSQLKAITMKTTVFSISIIAFLMHNISMQLGTKPKLPQRCRKWGLFIIAPRRISTIRDNRKFVISNYGPNEVSRRNRRDIGQASCRTAACNWHCQVKGSDQLGQPSGSGTRLFIRHLIIYDQLKKTIGEFWCTQRKWFRIE